MDVLTRLLGLYQRPDSCWGNCMYVLARLLGLYQRPDCVWRNCMDVLTRLLGLYECRDLGGWTAWLSRLWWLDSVSDLTLVGMAGTIWMS